jgi:hypothetical protein
MGTKDRETDNSAATNLHLTTENRWDFEAKTCAGGADSQTIQLQFRRISAAFSRQFGIAG